MCQSISGSHNVRNAENKKFTEKN